MCENHPHHFYLEILNDVGIVGFITIFSAVILLIIKILKNFQKKIRRLIKFIVWFFIRSSLLY